MSQQFLLDLTDVPSGQFRFGLAANDESDPVVCYLRKKLNDQPSLIRIGQTGPVYDVDGIRVEVESFDDHVLLKITVANGARRDAA